MPRKFTGTDVRPWKAATFGGKTLRDKSGKLLNNFRGFKDAKAAADKLGGVAIRT